MSRPTFISLFSGGGGADIGARDAGFEIAGGLEREAEIAEWYALNLGHQPIIDSIENVQPAQFGIAPDWLHASPPCQGDSVARSAIKTAHADIDAGIEVCRFIKAWKPAYFTLENVTGYSRNKSLYAIENCLLECGYWVRRLTLDASDYGIPQSRVRLWIIASRLDMPVPVLPNPSTKKMGWHEAIADLIPSLQPSKLSRWQVAKFAQNLPTANELIADCNTSSAVRRLPHEPAMTMGKSKDSCRPKIFLPDGLPSIPIPKVIQPPTSKKTQLIEGCTVLKASVECAARWQTFPHGYQLPQDVQTAGAIIGNAVPCKLAQLIGQSFNF